jgi:hypothetical protein
VNGDRPARPGVALFLAAFVFSPLVLVAWLSTAAVLRATGWPRWRVAVVAIAAGGLVVVVQGGPVPALEAHFAGPWSLLLQVGQPIVHLPLPGSFLWPQIPLAVPAGVLVATIHRPGVDLAVPDPGREVRERRRQVRVERRARALAARAADVRYASSDHPLGVSLGGDLPPSWRAGRYVVLPDHAAQLPRLALGRPGAGKSVYIGRETYLAGLGDRQAILLDGKGDRQFAAEVEAAYLAARPYATVHRFPAEPLSVWTGTPAELVNKLLGVWAWSLESQYYREVCILALRLACSQPGPPVTSMGELVTRLDPSALSRAWQGHAAEAGLVKTLRDKLGDVQLRMANLAAAAGGLLDGTRPLGEADLTVVSLPTMANRGDAEAIFRILMADLGHWASTRKGPRPAWVAVDEFSALDGGRSHAIELVERGRSAAVPVLLAGQSYASLGDEQQRDRLVSATGSVVLFASSTPDELVKLAGTVQAAEAVYAIEGGRWTGRASLTTRDRRRVDPNVIRQLAPGQAVIVSGGRAERMQVIRAPGRAEPRPAAVAARKPAPSGEPARAVDRREVPPPVQSRQGASPATRSPAASLDPPGRSSVREPRPPQVGPGSPPDDRAERAP